MDPMFASVWFKLIFDLASPENRGRSCFRKMRQGKAIMSAKKFIVQLSEQERARLSALISKGKSPAKVILKALAEKQVAFQAIMESVKTDLPKVPGCLGVSVMQDLEDPCRFTLVETWESSDKHKTHIANLIANGTWAGIESHLDGQPVLGYFRQL
jgi:quinol monooxygenase YgiN